MKEIKDSRNERYRKVWMQEMRDTGKYGRKGGSRKVGK